MGYCVAGCGGHQSDSGRNVMKVLFREENKILLDNHVFDKYGFICSLSTRYDVGRI